LYVKPARFPVAAGFLLFTR